MTRELQRELGRNVRRIRRSLELSQEAFAEAVDYHRTYIGGIERGERNLTLESVEALAERIGVDPIVLLTKPQPGEGPPEVRLQPGYATADRPHVPPLQAKPRT